MLAAIDKAWYLLNRGSMIAFLSYLGISVYTTCQWAGIVIFVTVGQKIHSCVNEYRHPGTTVYPLGRPFYDVVFMVLILSSTLELKPSALYITGLTALAIDLLYWGHVRYFRRHQA